MLNRSAVFALLVSAGFATMAFAQDSTPPAKPAEKPVEVPATAPAATPAATTPAAAPAKAEPKSLYEFSVPALSNDVEAPAKSLAEYKGKVALVVNVASKCGYTPQYKALEALYKELAEDGKKPFTVLAFPSNDFGSQEPGGAAEITQTCEKYSVTFPVFGKISVAGDAADPLYQWIVKQPQSEGEAPKWNFTKFLVDHTGKVVGRYDSRVRPDDSELRRRINELLAAAEKDQAKQPAEAK